MGDSEDYLRFKFVNRTKAAIASALHEIESNTNVRFYNATCEPPTDPTYGFQYPNIEFWSSGNADVSTSTLGRLGGVQRINLADFSFYYPWLNNLIIHEICHSLGMRHEHTRIDRDNYVNINTPKLILINHKQIIINQALTISIL